ncbi:hypothetical protein R69746_08144 [Paraburkholderia aspalathi]|nr:hypothetical protein R69746_08144 [Paraburkholderia aspalathi]
MREQWIGDFRATVWQGMMVIDAETVGGKLGGSVSMFPAEGSNGTATIARIVPAEVNTCPAQLLLLMNPIHPVTGVQVPWHELERVFPNMRFGTIAQASVEWQEREMTVTWHSNIGTQGQALLHKSSADRPPCSPAGPPDGARLRTDCPQVADALHRAIQLLRELDMTLDEGVSASGPSGSH